MSFLKRLDDFFVKNTEPLRRWERRNATPLMRQAEVLQDKLALILANPWSRDEADVRWNAIVYYEIEQLEPYYTGENTDYLAYTTVAAHCEEFVAEFNRARDKSVIIKRYSVQIKRKK